MRVYCLITAATPKIYSPHDDITYLTTSDPLTSLLKILRQLTPEEKEDGVVIIRGPVIFRKDFKSHITQLTQLTQNLCILGYRILNQEIWTTLESQYLTQNLKCKHPDLVKDVLGFWIRGPAIQDVLDKLDLPFDKYTGVKSLDLVTRFNHLLLYPPYLISPDQKAKYIDEDDYESERVIGFDN